MYFLRLSDDTMITNIILVKCQSARPWCATFVAIAEAVTPLRTQPRALPVALDPYYHFQLSDWSRGAMRHLRKRLTDPRADSPRWRATVLAVCDGCSAATDTTDGCT